ncbi:uncharacterized [Tachysurus ichikawai]
MVRPDQRVNGSKPKTDAYDSKARPPNTNHKQLCSGRDAPPQPELTSCLRDAEPKTVKGRSFENGHLTPSESLSQGLVRRGKKKSYRIPADFLLGSCQDEEWKWPFVRGSPAAGFQSLQSERSRNLKAWEPAMDDESHTGKQVNRKSGGPEEPV